MHAGPLSSTCHFSLSYFPSAKPRALSLFPHVALSSAPPSSGHHASAQPCRRENRLFFVVLLKVAAFFLAPASLAARAHAAATCASMAGPRVPRRGGARGPCAAARSSRLASVQGRSSQLAPAACASMAFASMEFAAELAARSACVSRPSLGGARGGARGPRAAAQSSRLASKGGARSSRPWRSRPWHSRPSWRLTALAPRRLARGRGGPSRPVEVTRSWSSGGELTRSAKSRTRTPPVEFTGDAHQVFVIMSMAWWMIFSSSFHPGLAYDWEIYTPKN